MKHLRRKKRFVATLSALDVSAPIFFVAVGFLSANGPVAVIEVNVHGETLKSLAELYGIIELLSEV